MPDWLAQSAAAHGPRLAVVGDDDALTYAQLDARADELAGRLAAAGVARGDRVGVMLPASAEHVALLHALMRLGAVLVPLDPRSPAAEVERRATHARLTLRFAQESGAGAVGLAGLRRGPRARVERAEPEGLHAIVFTSGTSGAPRAAMLTYANHAASAAQVAAHLRLAARDRWLACVPLFHVGGLAVVTRSMLTGSAFEVHSRFDAARVSAALDEATVASMVPVMLRKVLDARGPRPFPSSLRAVLLGGDAAPPELLREARARGLAVLPTYGLTEAASTVACAAPGEPCPPGSSGRALSGTEVRILGEDDAPRGAGEVGEVAVRGPTVMQGYWADDAATRRALRGGWLRTGDLGLLDKDGFLCIVGRLGDRITTGAEKVDPVEVEAAMRAHPDVLDACVVGVPDTVWGQQVVAAVVLRPGARLDEEALRAHCKARLAGHKVPKRVVSFQGLPRNETGKVQRAKVAEDLARP